MAPEMTAADVLAVLDRLDAAGVWVCIDGGWGVDALVGRETRGHRDLDVVVLREELARARDALAPLGFEHARDVTPGLPARLVLRDPRGRTVDFHPVVLDEDGNGLQELGDGTWGLYPGAGLRGAGTISGRPVRCTTPELQLRHHLGYEPDDVDRHDVGLLVQRFGLAAPPPYG